MGKDNLTVITSYPKKGEIHSTKTVGVASYTKQLLVAFKKVYPKTKVKVFAEVLDNKESYKEGDIDVERFWSRGSFIDIYQLFFKILFLPSKKLLVSLEANMFLPATRMLFFLISLIILRLLGKEVTLILHQVFGSYLTVEKNRLKAILLNLIYLKPYYFLVFLASSKIIVFEEALRERLKRPNKVYTLSHLVPQSETLDKITSRKKLGLDKDYKYTMCFGYIAPYKGIENLVYNWPQGENKLIIAGSINPNHKNDPKIVKYVKNIEQSAHDRGIMLTGFIDEELLPYYFSAVDFCVLPYITFMSSSGPLSLALSYRKPIIMDKVLVDYAKSKDFGDALKESGLTVNDLVYERDPESLRELIDNIDTKSRMYLTFAELLSSKRKPAAIGDQLGKILVR